MSRAAISERRASDQIGDSTLIRLTARAVLLDIEGTVSSISFVRETMFPYVRNRLADFLDRHADDPEVVEACRLVLEEARSPVFFKEGLASTSSYLPAVEAAVHRLMDEDKKVTGLKSLQGMIWKEGFDTGELRATLFSDVRQKLREWKASGLILAIYSSGSIAAQKLFFAHTTEGDLTSFFSAHFDTTIGGKKESNSYARIANALNIPTNDIVFISDIEGELLAAKDAGLQTILSLRPGNDPVSNACSIQSLSTFHDLEVQKA